MPHVGSGHWNWRANPPLFALKLAEAQRTLAPGPAMGLRHTGLPMSPIHLTPLTLWITQAALEHGPRLPEHLMQRLTIKRRTANKLLKDLVAAQWLASQGSRRKTDYRPGVLRQVVQRYPLERLQEDLPWRTDFAPCFELPAEVGRMVRYAFTELLNNAVDHSGGSTVTVSLRQTPLQAQLLVSDDGCGLFDCIAQGFGIADPHLALLDLSKGKLTSAPDAHCGHGLYFTARLADVLCLQANQVGFQRRAWEAQPWRNGTPAAQRGTSVYLAIALDTPRTLDSVLCDHSLSPGSYAFDRTEVPLQLMATDAVLASRAEARRALARLAQFRRADINFSGIEDIGQGFADEMFRVFRKTHPGVELVPVGMAPRVAAKVAQAGAV